MDMAFGRRIAKIINKAITNSIKGIMQWIRNQAMVYMNGKMDGLIKEIFRMT